MTTSTETRTATTRHASPADGESAGTLVRHLRHRRRSVALGLLVSAQFVVMLDTSIVNVALPSIQTDLGLSSTGLTWVVNAYVLAFGGLLLLSGRAADLIGRRRMFIAGSTLFTLGTLMAAGAHDQGLLVVGRLVQGAGAAALSPAAMSLLLLTFPGQQRAKAMSLWGAASTLGGATGVMLGGLLAVPVSVAAIVLASYVLEEGPVGTRRRLDGRGAVTITGAVVALVHGALAAADHGWTSPTVIISLATAALLLVAFVMVERRTPLTTWS
jgi:MFS family permease